MGRTLLPHIWQIYLPALNTLASDLNVSNTLINLTLTSYMIFQGLAPAFIGDLADTMGRRPAYAICFVIYIGANIGLALQDSYAALFILRCLQSSGSSGTIAMTSGVVSDIATAQERGSYMGLTMLGSLLGPAVGPVIGGLLSQYLGWRSIFWFLCIMGGVFFVVFAIFFPETARSQVGNGSIPPVTYSMSLMNYLAIRKARRLQRETEKDNDNDTVQSRPEDLRPRPKAHFPNPLSSLAILYDKLNACLLFYNAFLFSAFYQVSSSIPSQFAQIYHFNDLHIGLCFLPYGCGAITAALINGQVLDRNFARWCRNLNVTPRKNRQMDLDNFPIEKARLQIAIPATYATIALILIFGWLIDISAPLAPVLVVLFFQSLTMSMAFNVVSTLIVDYYPGKSATATAANNLTRCLLGAGATAAIVPMINAWGRGVAFTALVAFLVGTSPLMWVVWFRGMRWRQERSKREVEREREKGRSRGGTLEAGGAIPIVGSTPEQSSRSREKLDLVTSRPLVSEGRQSTSRSHD
ncbi:Quinidine resistance protein 2 [Cyphellophora attinorum]|uniref:Quinidine resistance protein 2 n=1 Tax=Cyphellophora attinorum TaxID=1664694 RepID=A0A0N1H750_9EURO|nr:Quinidine resistance protein 2 [Phialophora attinorum]KPI38376.1 Quinidine resistance protein 2 [Phialophora attinorum]